MKRTGIQIERSDLLYLIYVLASDQCLHRRYIEY